MSQKNIGIYYKVWTMYNVSNTKTLSLQLLQILHCDEPTYKYEYDV